MNRLVRFSRFIICHTMLNMVKIICDKFFDCSPKIRLRILSSLTPREEGALEMLYGILDDGKRTEPQKFDAVGFHYCIPRIRMKEIIAKAETKVSRTLIYNFWPAIIE